MLFFIVMLSRIFWLQVIDWRDYTKQAHQQQNATKELKAKRGSILAHEKDRIVPLATTKEGWLLSIDPRLVENPEGLYSELTSIFKLGITREEFILRASKSDDPYEAIEHKVSIKNKDRVEAAKLSGVFFSPERWRVYPAGSIASQATGFVDKDAIGKYGIEQFYHFDLLGENGVFEGETDLRGRLLLLGSPTIKRERNGVDVLLTIDLGVQAYLEDILSSLYDDYDAASAGGIILNPKTGSIIAMANIPTFDPNNYSDVENFQVFANPQVESLFEMGSVIKPLTMAAAIDADVVVPQDTYYDAGTLEIDTEVIANFDKKGRGRVDMQQILSQSLNTGAVFLMERLGKDRFKDYFNKFGLDELTNIDLPNEVEGNLKNLDSNRTIEFATAAYGQGISVTTVELVRALGSLANGGLLIDPYLVEEVHYANGGIVAKKKSKPQRVIKEESATTVTRMLVEIVDRGLGAGANKIPGYSVAAKTGTAQIANVNEAGYSNEFLHTFIGYGPAYDAQFLMLLYLERPVGARYASETLVRPFMKTMKHLFSYFEVLPDRTHEL
jgi:cell division protein FtsI/penicillin-binding protein 2